MKQSLRVKVGLCALLLGLSGGVPASAADLEIAVVGVGNKELETYLKDSLSAISEPENSGPRSTRYQAQKARQLLTKALAAKGFYQPEVDLELERGDKPKATFTIMEGPQTIMNNVQVDGAPYEPDILKPGEPLLAEPVLAEQKELFEKISREGCRYGLEVNHTAILDPQDHSADLVFNVTDKGDAHIGDLQITGLKRVKEDHVRKMIELRRNDCYKATEIERTQMALLQSGLFSIVKLNMPEAPSPDGSVPINIDVKESKFRTVKAGVSYYTDEGPGVVLGWEHRNFFGRGEKLTTDLKISTLEQSLSAIFKKPFFMRKDQSLNLGADLKNETTDAYDAFTLGINANVKRQINHYLDIGLGGGYKISHVTEDDDSEDYALLYGQGFANWDNRDDALDPHKGFKARLDLKPFIDTLNPGTVFWKTELNGSTYFALFPNSTIDPVIALRGRFGSIFGPSVANLPATERFYAGGGGSVRGFAYQEIGPENDDGDPSGGRAVLETSAELRLKFTEKIGAVAFLDGGNVSEAVLPGMDNGYAWGAGVGARYYTDFGPLRFDVGVPLTQKDKADSAFQVYISIGQAF